MKLSPKAVKPEKAQAQTFIAKLKDGGKLTPLEIDGLYLYFTPALPKKAKTAMQWVSKAVDPKETREGLRYIWVSDGYAYGSDGGRVHKAKVDLDDGWYCAKALIAVDVAHGLEPLPYNKILDVTIEQSFITSTAEFTHQVVTKKPCLIYDDGNNVAGFNNQYLCDALNSDLDKSFFIEKVARDRWLRASGKSEFGQWVVGSVRV